MTSKNGKKYLKVDDFTPNADAKKEPVAPIDNSGDLPF